MLLPYRQGPVLLAALHARFDKLEDGIERLCSAFMLSPVKAELIRTGVLDELAVTREVMFAVDDIDATVSRLRARGAELVGEVAHVAAGPPMVRWLRGRWHRFGLALAVPA